MATDQDATAARVRNAVIDAVWALGKAKARYDADRDGTLAWVAPPRDALDAALDTLIEYHATKGAVEACKEGVTRFCPPRSALRETCGQEATFNGKPHQRSVCGSHLMLAAAQARLAAYEEER